METYSIYIRNAPWRATEDDLLAVMQAEGIGPVVGVRIIQDPETGRSRGYGFVDCADPKTRDKVCRMLDGLELFGRRLAAEPAKPPRQQRGR
ncbi:MAG: RNA recognition motif domain-containing protein [Armatimonadota bacterium]